MKDILISIVRMLITTKQKLNVRITQDYISDNLKCADFSKIFYVNYEDFDILKGFQRLSQFNDELQPTMT